jgi:hypothetical protein
MNLRAIKHALAVLLVAALATLASPSAGQGQVAGPSVYPGWDLLQTLPGTVFMNIPFHGVPLDGSFGGSNGYDFYPAIQPPQNTFTGMADTIIQRLQVANAPATAISIELVKLQLMSDDGTLFVTLQRDRAPGEGPRQASLGNMTINFNAGLTGGTFNSSFDVNFDIRTVGFNGPIMQSNHLQLSANGVNWQHQFPDAGLLAIDKVNHVLFDGMPPSEQADFWPLGPFQETHEQSLAIHQVRTADSGSGGGGGNPEPSAFLLCSIGLLCTAGYFWRRWHRAA